MVVRAGKSAHQFHQLHVQLHRLCLAVHGHFRRHTLHQINSLCVLGKYHSTPRQLQSINRITTDIPGDNGAHHGGQHQRKNYLVVTGHFKKDQDGSYGSMGHSSEKRSHSNQCVCSGRSNGFRKN